MVNRSREALPVLKVFGYAGACLVALGGVGINYTISSVQTVVREDMDKKFEGMDKKFDKKFEGMAQKFEDMAKDLRHFALVSSERLAVLESKLGIPRGGVTLPPPSQDV